MKGGKSNVNYTVIDGDFRQITVIATYSCMVLSTNVCLEAKYNKWVGEDKCN